MDMEPTVVVMAKPAVPGRVKTRLCLAGGLEPRQAAQVHRALLECVLGRVGPLFDQRLRRVLAVDGGVLNPAEAYCVHGAEDWRVIDQGQGDLGVRMDHVWRVIGGGAVIFLGVDSPDLPTPTLETLPAALEQTDGAIGPSDDGGYWTLAVGTYHPALLRGIDWGGPNVYDQTVDGAERAGLTLSPLTPWDDVDDPEDLARLHERLTHTQDPYLVQLFRRLNHCLSLSTKESP